MPGPVDTSGIIRERPSAACWAFQRQKQSVFLAAAPATVDLGPISASRTSASGHLATLRIALRCNHWPMLVEYELQSNI